MKKPLFVVYGENFTGSDYELLTGQEDKPNQYKLYCVTDSEVIILTLVGDFELLTEKPISPNKDAALAPMVDPVCHFYVQADDAEYLVAYDELDDDIFTSTSSVSLLDSDKMSLYEFMRDYEDEFEQIRCLNGDLARDEEEN